MTPPTRPLRIVHMVSSIGLEASGPSYSVPRLCEALVRRGHAVELHVYAWTASTPDVEGVQVTTYPVFPFPRKLGISPRMGSGLRMAAQRADIVHSHGLWMLSNVYAARAAAFARTPLVTSPRGALSPAALAHSRIPKAIMWRAGQARALSQVACFHATSDDERHQIERRCPGVRVAVIPNGVDAPPPAITRARRADGRKTLLFLGRIHPIKGVDLLLRVWRNLQGRFPDWDLVIVGPPEGTHERDMRALARELSLVRVTFAGPKFGPDKWAAYAAADLFVLPTESENFGMSVAEALVSAVPVVVTHGAPWAALEAHGAGHWIERTPEALELALAQAMTLPPDEREAMGHRGSEWMQREFSWDAIAMAFERTYAQVVDAAR